MNLDNAEVCYYIWGEWPSHQCAGIEHWFGANLAKGTYGWRMTVPYSPPPPHFEHRFAFDSAEDLAVFLLSWPARRVRHIDWEEYYNVDRD